MTWKKVKKWLSDNKIWIVLPANGGHSGYLFGCSFFYEKGSFWFRFGSSGPGIRAKDTRKLPLLLFSERNGFCRMVRIGPWMFRYLEKK